MTSDKTQHYGARDATKWSTFGSDKAEKNVGRLTRYYAFANFTPGGVSETHCLYGLDQDGVFVALWRLLLQLSASFGCMLAVR